MTQDSQAFFCPFLILVVAKCFISFVQHSFDYKLPFCGLYQMHKVRCSAGRYGEGCWEEAHAREQNRAREIRAT